MGKNNNYKFRCFGKKKYINLAFIITLLLLSLILCKNSTIVLTIDSNEKQVTIFNNNFNSFPDDVLLDGYIIQKLYIEDFSDSYYYNRQIYNFPRGKHNVTLIWKNLDTCYFMFCNAKDIISVHLSDFDTSTVTNMHHMFFNCNKLTSIDVSTFNTQLVVDMKNMFEQCSSLVSLDLSNFNTSQVTEMSWMFAKCPKLKSLNINNFDVSKVKLIEGMFLNCELLTYLNLSNFYTSSVTTLKDLFNGCTELTSLDLSNFDTSKVTNMENMFNYSKSLSSLNLFNFNTSLLSSYTNIFSNINSNLSYCINEENENKIINELRNYKRYKIVYEGFKCIENCKDDNLCEYKNICYNLCPIGTYNSSFICEEIECDTKCKTCTLESKKIVYALLVMRAIILSIMKN